MQFFMMFYVIVVLLLAVYCFHRYALIYLHVRYSRREYRRQDPQQWPMVTVQLPVFNEPAVTLRLMRGALGLDYPADRLEIQVLDDSTDATTQIVSDFVRQARLDGRNIAHLHRTDRKGFKAGALHEGLKTSSGEFVAIFDADFVPRREFLKTLIPYFVEERVGVVQATWAHFNRRSSLLTRLQEVFMVSHFSIEQKARSASGRFFNFNGTCGIWRRAAIDDAGGWQGDTLAEDMDLSYRAQMNGWRFVYIDQVLADAELPADMNAFKKQQERWTKGTMQVARKDLIPVLTSNRLSLPVKIEAFFHLTSNIAYPLGLLTALCILPSIFWGIFVSFSGLSPIFNLCFFVALTLVSFVYHFYGQCVRHGWGSFRHIPAVLAAVGVPMGLSVMLSIATFKGLFGKKVFFARTPKTGGAVGRKTELVAVKNFFLVSEVALCVYFLWGACYAYHHGYTVSAFFLLLFTFGFGYVGLMSLPVFVSSPFRSFFNSDLATKPQRS